MRKPACFERSVKPLAEIEMFVPNDLARVFLDAWIKMPPYTGRYLSSDMKVEVTCL